MPSSTDDLAQRLDALRAKRVECSMSDFSSVARGKVITRADFITDRGCRMPSGHFSLTLTGRDVEAAFEKVLPRSFADMTLVADLSTLVAAHGMPATASVICDLAGPLHGAGGSIDASALSPRAALKCMCARLAEAGLQATVAPELEFQLLRRPHDGESGGLRAPAPQPGSAAIEQACEAYSLERCAHFAPFFDALLRACEAAAIPLTGYQHEAAWSQFEVNFAPGAPLAQADAVFRFKRLARQIAAPLGYLATFVPKAFLHEPGNGMHWHLSLQHLANGRNAFVDAHDADAPALLHFIAGLQRHAGETLALLAPYDASFERIVRANAAPSQATWGYEDRTVAFRIPNSAPAHRRIEHRLPGADTNPYLVLAALLGLGLRGMQDAAMPMPAEELPALPRTLDTALDALSASAALREVLGDPLVAIFVAQKRAESAERRALADPREDWDHKVLLEQA